jgi:hypothetical protein
LLNGAGVSSQELGVELIALDDAPNVTPMLVMRGWKTAKAWLHREISHEF